MTTFTFQFLSGESVYRTSKEQAEEVGVALSMLGIVAHLSE